MESPGKVQEVDMTSESAEDHLILDWNYRADFIRLMSKLPKLTRKRQEQIQYLMVTCLALAEESEDAPVDTLNKFHAEELRITEQVFPHRSPFEIPELFKQILSYVPVNTLLTCRLVNQRWNENSVPWIRAKKKKSVSINYKNFHKFSTDFGNVETLPLTKLEFSVEDLSHDQVSKFLTEHGSSISHLRITVSKRIQDDELLFLKKLQLLLRHVPNLRNLKLYVEYKDWEIFPELSSVEDQVNVSLPRVESLVLDYEGSLSQHFLEGFFPMFPNVGIIKLEGPGDDQDWKGFVSPMAKLNVHTALTIQENPDIWSAMTAERSLKLRNVSMHLSDPSDTTEDGNEIPEREFLRSQSENLEILSLTFHELDLENQLPFQLPVFKNLTRAMFLYYTDGNEYFNFNPIVPLEPEQVPELKYLCITPETITSGLFADSLFPSVTEIKFSKGSEEDVSALPQIVATFPNLRKLSNLEIKANLTDMEILFTNLGSIQDLELKIVNDEEGTLKNFNLALSGIPGTAGTKCVMSQLAHRVGYELLPLWIHPPRPSLRNLTHLQRLVLGFHGKTKDLAARVCIDEIGVYMAFLRMSSQLSLTLEGDFLISDELAGKLTTHFRNIYFLPAELMEDVGGHRELGEEEPVQDEDLDF